VKVTDNLSINIRDNWIEILSKCDNQFISVSPNEFDVLAKTLQALKSEFTQRSQKVVLYADGGTAGGNPGRGYGSCCLTVNGQEYRGRGEFGPATSNEAEYFALLLGLDEVVKGFGTDVELEIRLDSALLIGQLSRGWKVKAENLHPLWAETKQKLGWFHSCKLVKVGRDEVVKVLGH